ncbi:tetratricopeptide repeat protein [Nocardia iowensis]|uniref:ATP-binding protein n=1 Tax=Nocardia iowensis TaxID=204891 RepID=A0ABX8RJH9_NOCIO|nr:tetratricopeptide repeat protein [Nocardia iowensis]QXN89042.1 ATP-binding protein [Nocardia iowensis]
MGGRLALVVGSECAALPELGFVHRLATDLYASLTSVGAWAPATAHAGPVINPGASELADVIGTAFDTAGDRQASLLVAFIGHGITTGPEDFYLLAYDSPALPDSRTAVHLTQTIRERLNRSALDGLVVLIDACEAEEGVRGAARRWTDLLARSAGRVELLVASDDGPAYEGCFTRTMLGAFEEGLAARGENLLPSDLVDPIAARCVQQRPQHLSYAMGNESASPGGDPGLWLVPNMARRRDALTGRPAAGFVDHLTRRLRLTGTIRERLTEIVESGSHRLRAVVGPPAAGKSTVMAMLIRPTIVDGLPIAPEYVTAAVFLTVNSSMEAVAAELSAQLSSRLRGFDDALREVRLLAERSDPKPDTFDIEVRLPLARLASPGTRVTIVLDGLDQPETGSRDLLIRAIADLTTSAEFTHVRLVISIRTGTGVEDAPELAHMHRITLSEPSARDIADILLGSTRSKLARYHSEAWVRWIDALLAETPTSVFSGSHAVAGGWLVARLLIEVDSMVTPAEVSQGIGLDTLIAHRVGDAIVAADPAIRTAIGPLLGVLVAAGAGPVLPIELAAAAMAQLGAELSTAQIRDLVVGLGVLVSRSRPGAASEALGVTHGALLPALITETSRLGIEVEDAHRAITAAIEADSADQAAEYARDSAVRHYLAYRDGAAAVAYLENTVAKVVEDNRETWAAWLPSFVTVLGLDAPATLAARHNLAVWRAANYQTRREIVEFAQALTARLRERGRHLPEMGSIPGIDEDDDLTTIAAEFEQLLTERLRVLGPDHPDTLTTRGALAQCRGKLGDPVGAAAELDRVLTEHLRVFGPDHPDTHAARRALAHCHGEAGDPGRAAAELDKLLADRSRLLGGADKERTQLSYEIADWYWRSGETLSAIGRLTELHAEQVEVLGPDHDSSLDTRYRLAVLRGASGDTAGAIEDLGALLSDLHRLHRDDDLLTEMVALQLHLLREPPVNEAP